MLKLARSNHIEIDLLKKQLHFYQGQRLSRTYPVAIGKPSTPSPVGEWTIINKKILNYDSIFGTRWMGLSNPGYGIHGTNNPSSIGKAVSLGCIRMYNHNVEEIFAQVSIGTPVIIYNGNSSNSNFNPETPITPKPNPNKSITDKPVAIKPELPENNPANPSDLFNSSSKTYKIKSGDTLWGISNRLNIPLHHLIKANPHIDPDNLQIGQIINLP